jgi:polyvinyl alcohol dehydrogenase (cytochrome)
VQKATLAVAAGTLAVMCSAWSGPSHGPAAQHPAGTLAAAVHPASVAPTFASEPPAASGTSWTSYHGDAEASGVQAAPIKLLPSRTAWTSPTLDGQLYGEPLVADGRVVEATENDTVYALAANTGKILWSSHLGTPVPSGDLPCGDISPVVGITGTPVIDPARNEVFVVADTLVKGPSSSKGVEASHRLFGLNLLTGQVELHQTAMPSAGEDQLAQLQRPGLALDQGRVVIAYGQNSGDCPGPNGPAHGYVVSIPETGGPLDYFQVGSGSDRGAVWMGGSSPVIDSQGNVYVASGDGYNLGAGQPYDDSDAVLELTPAMHLESDFYLSNWQQLSGDDRDLGTGDPALVDGFVFQVGKTDTAYLLRQGHLGGQDGEVASLPLCSGDPDGGHVVTGSVVYVPCPNGVTAVRVSTKAPYLTKLWTASDGASSPPIFADGLIWTILDGQVRGLNPASGTQQVAIPFGTPKNHFPTPTAADGLLLLPGAAQVYAFVGPAGLPPAPTAIPVLSHGRAVATAPTRETVTWDQTVPSWEKFTIVGPGAINGHVGWVPPGITTAYYSGLASHHGYTVTYTPYTAKNGSPVQGAIPGQVYFVS